MNKHRACFTLILIVGVGLAARPATAGLVGSWSFDGNLQDSSGLNNHGTFSGGTANYVMDRLGVAGNALEFDGINDKVRVGTTSRPTNNFSFGGWIKTSQVHQIDAETNASTTGTGGQRYAFGAEYLSAAAGAGLSIGANGISVYEHTSGYMPSLAVYNPGNSTAVGTGWNHVLVVYQDRRPTIYLNGVPVRTGVQSAKATVYAPVEIGGGTYGYLDGVMDDVKVWDYALSPADVAQLAGRTTLVTNGSFERDPFANWPGYISGNAKISHWTASQDTAAGLSPSTSAGPNGEDRHAFADNGIIPDGHQVAFLQSNAKTVSLTQSVSGFQPGSQYMVVYRENARAGVTGKPNVSVTLDDQTVVASHTVSPVDGLYSYTQPYRYVGSSIFTAANTTHDLQFIAANATADSTALIDAVEVLPMRRAFGDNFDVQNPVNSISPNPANDLPGRQRGLAGALTYLESPADQATLHDPTYPGALTLQCRENSTSCRVSPNRNFKEFANGPTHFVLECDINPTAKIGSSAPWAAVVLGSSSQTAFVNGSDGIGLLLREDGGFELFEDTERVLGAGSSTRKLSGNVTSYGAALTEWFHVRINYFVPVFDDVTQGNVAVFVNDKLIYSGQTDGGFLNNYITLMGYRESTYTGFANHGFDNLQLWTSTVPEPSAFVLVGLGGFVLLLRRRWRRE